MGAYLLYSHLCLVEPGCIDSTLPVAQQDQRPDHALLELPQTDVTFSTFWTGGTGTPLPHRGQWLHAGGHTVTAVVGVRSSSCLTCSGKLDSALHPCGFQWHIVTPAGTQTGAPKPSSAQPSCHRHVCASTVLSISPLCHAVVIFKHADISLITPCSPVVCMKPCLCAGGSAGTTVLLQLPHLVCWAPAADAVLRHQPVHVLPAGLLASGHLLWHAL